jgi:anaerobic C4-dicarboxylate transporter
MALFVLVMVVAAGRWVPAPAGTLYTFSEFAHHPGAPLVAFSLLGVSVTGGMFVVPLYAFLTTTVESDHTARTVAANNIVNSGLMVVGAVAAIVAANFGVSVVDALASVAVMCLGAAALSWRLHRACDGVDCNG